jgi:hypothetical protein
LQCPRCQYDNPPGSNFCPLGDIATQSDRFDAESGEGHYRQTLALAEPRGVGYWLEQAEAESMELGA